MYIYIYIYSDNHLEYPGTWIRTWSIQVPGYALGVSRFLDTHLEYPGTWIQFEYPGTWIRTWSIQVPGYNLNIQVPGYNLNIQVPGYALGVSRNLDTVQDPGRSIQRPGYSRVSRTLDTRECKKGKQELTRTHKHEPGSLICQCRRSGMPCSSAPWQT